MSTKKYKVGDIVRLRQDLEDLKYYGDYIFVKEMSCLCDKDLTITGCYVSNVSGFKGYEISTNGETYIRYKITDEMIDRKLEPIELLETLAKKLGVATNQKTNRQYNNRVENFIYEKGRKTVQKYNGTMDLISRYSFEVKELKEKVIYSNNAVIVILDDGSKGVAKCMDIDDFDEIKGLKIAYNKAKIKSLQKELKKLTK